MNVLLMIVVIALMQGISFWYLFKQYKKSKKIIIYLVIMTFLLIGQAIGLEKIYLQNSLIHNIKLLVLEGGLIVLAVTDKKEYRIPNEIIIVLAALRVAIFAAEIVLEPERWIVILKDASIALLLIGVFLLVLKIIAKNGIGYGDIKLMMIMSVYQGFLGVFSSVFLSLIITSVVGVFLLATKRKKKKDNLAFAPMVLIGLFISITMTGI